MYIDEDQSASEPARVAIGQVIAERFYEALAEHWDERIALIDAWEKRDIQPSEMRPFTSVEITYLQNRQANAELWREILAEDASTMAEKIERIRSLDLEVHERMVQALLENDHHRDFIQEVFRVFRQEDIDQTIREQSDRMIGFTDSINRMTFIRSASDLEGEDGTTLQTRRRSAGLELSLIDERITWVSQLLPKHWWPDLTDLEHVLFYREAVLIREMTLTGIVADYLTRWDGPTNQYPTGFVTPETGERLMGLLKKSKMPENAASGRWGASCGDDRSTISDRSTKRFEMKSP
ncbi:MAG TPA: hypothetical protein GXZ74_07010 [Tissierellia bacterium]|nr:hypothetical protein [Tissierellia bacterium]